MKYAGRVEQQLEAQLGGDSEAAERLRSYLMGASAQSDVIALSVWVNGDGAISRVAFAPFLDPQANKDLTSLMQVAKLSGPPPKGLLLPIHLRLHVAAHRDVSAADGGNAAQTPKP